MSEPAHDQAEGDRPSFTNFWKRSKEVLTGKQITFVSANVAGQSATSPGSGGEGGSQQQEPSQEEKAQLRRAQVRKAQIHHRQRKANYVKELELDVVRIRDMIAQTERDTMRLRGENESMRTRLRSAGIAVPPSAWKGKQVAQQEHRRPRQQRGSPAPTGGAGLVGRQDAGIQGAISHSPRQQTLYVDQPYDHVNQPPPSAATELFADINVNDIQVTLSMDSTMGTPCYKITSSSSSSSFTSAMSPLPEEPQEEGLSLTQQDQAVNFILALEYVCWNHFHPKDFPAKGDAGGRASCHTLMASTFCMASAPDNVYKDRKSVKRKTTTSSSSSHQHQQQQAPAAPALSWQAGGGGLTLANLRGLAASLNPGDKELTPVQAWFELAASHDVGLLLGDGGGVVEALKSEFVGVVKCVQYGATIERQAFHSIVDRVMGRYVVAAPPHVAAGQEDVMMVDHHQPMADQPGMAF